MPKKSDKSGHRSRSGSEREDGAKGGGGDKQPHKSGAQAGGSPPRQRKSPPKNRAKKDQQRAATTSRPPSTSKGRHHASAAMTDEPSGDRMVHQRASTSSGVSSGASSQTSSAEYPIGGDSKRPSDSSSSSLSNIESLPDLSPSPSDGGELASQLQAWTSDPQPETSPKGTAAFDPKAAAAAVQEFPSLIHPEAFRFKDSEDIRLLMEEATEYLLADVRTAVNEYCQRLEVRIPHAYGKSQAVGGGSGGGLAPLAEYLGPQEADPTAVAFQAYAHFTRHARRTTRPCLCFDVSRDCNILNEYARMAARYIAEFEAFIKQEQTDLVKADQDQPRGLVPDTGILKVAPTRHAKPKRWRRFKDKYFAFFSVIEWLKKDRSSRERDGRPLNLLETATPAELDVIQKKLVLAPSYIRGDNSYLQQKLENPPCLLSSDDEPSPVGQTPSSDVPPPLPPKQGRCMPPLSPGQHPDVPPLPPRQDHKPPLPPRQGHDKPPLPPRQGHDMPPLPPMQGHDMPPMQGDDMPPLPPMQGHHMPPMQGDDMPPLPPIQGHDMPPMQGDDMPPLPPMQGHDMPPLPLSQGHDMPPLPPMQGRDIPPLPPRQGHDMPPLPPMQGHDIPPLPLSQGHDLPPLPPRQGRDMTALPPRQGHDQPPHSQRQGPGSSAIEESDFAMVDLPAKPHLPQHTPPGTEQSPSKRSRLKDLSCLAGSQGSGDSGHLLARHLPGASIPKVLEKLKKLSHHLRGKKKRRRQKDRSPKTTRPQSPHPSHDYLAMFDFSHGHHKSHRSHTRSHRNRSASAGELGMRRLKSPTAGSAFSVQSAEPYRRHPGFMSQHTSPLHSPAKKSSSLLEPAFRLSLSLHDSLGGMSGSSRMKPLLKMKRSMDSSRPSLSSEQSLASPEGAGALPGAGAGPGAGQTSRGMSESAEGSKPGSVHTSPPHSPTGRDLTSFNDLSLQDKSELRRRDSESSREGREEGAEGTEIAPHRRRVHADVHHDPDRGARERFLKLFFRAAHARDHDYLVRLLRSAPDGAWLSACHPELHVTPLMLAVLRNDLGLVELLVSLGADPNTPMSAPPGWTALHLACLHGEGCSAHRLVVALLDQGGGDVNRAAANGLTPLDLALCTDHKHLAVLYDLFDTYTN